MKKIIIIGATSGIGLEITKILLNKGWLVGAAGRKLFELEQLKSLYPNNLEISAIDIKSEDSPEHLHALIEKLGEMDVFLNCAGIGFNNWELEASKEVATVRTNAEGFVRIISAAYHYFSIQRKGHIAAITSIAGTKGLGSAPAYSATKRFESIYLDSLEQLSCLRNLNISFTDIKPGFVNTPLLSDGNIYPLMMKPDFVARQIVKAIEKKKRVAVIDWRYAILVFFWKLIPRCIWKNLPIRTKQKTHSTNQD